MILRFHSILFLCATAIFAEAEPGPISVAVLPFSGHGVDSISALVVSDALSDELMRTGQVQVMERSQIKSILNEQGFQQSGACDGSECAVQTGRILSVQDIVVGTIGKLGDSYSLSVRLVNVETGEVTRSSHRMQQGAIDAVVAQTLPQIAAELLGAPAPRPTIALKQKSSSDSVWNTRHDGFHFRSQMVAGISSATETPLSLRLGGEYNGFGAMIGAGPIVPILNASGAIDHQDVETFIPNIELFYGWNRYQFEVGYSRLDLRNSDGSDVNRRSLTTIAADMEIHFGLPGRPNKAGGFGLLLGVGYAWFNRSLTYTYFNGYTIVTEKDEPDSDSFPILNFAILLSDW